MIIVQIRPVVSESNFSELTFIGNTEFWVSLGGFVSSRKNVLPIHAKCFIE